MWHSETKSIQRSSKYWVLKFWSMLFWKVFLPVHFGFQKFENCLVQKLQCHRKYASKFFGSDGQAKSALFYGRFLNFFMAFLLKSHRILYHINSVQPGVFLKTQNSRDQTMHGLLRTVSKTEGNEFDPKKTFSLFKLPKSVTALIKSNVSPSRAISRKLNDETRTLYIVSPAFIPFPTIQKLF